MVTLCGHLTCPVWSGPYAIEEHTHRSMAQPVRILDAVRLRTLQPPSRSPDRL